MLNIQDQGVKLCDSVSRRDWLRIGSLGAFGLTMPQLMAQKAQAAGFSAGTSKSFGKAKRCIVLFLLGGPPQQETWDPKPQAPTETRGPYKPIASSLPGLPVCELMPRTAKLAHKVAVLRAMATDDNAHSSSGYWMLTGTPHQPKNRESGKPGAPNNWPCVAAVVRHLKENGPDAKKRMDVNGRPAILPASVRLPEEIWNTGRIVWPGQDAGWLGDAADPWLLHCHPHKPDFKVPDIRLPNEISTARFRNRETLLQNVNRQLQQVEQAGKVGRWDNLRQQTFDLLRSPRAQKAFQLYREPAKVRDQYGRNRFGQSVLLARRLVEAGVSLVQVNWTRWDYDVAVNPAWDTHAKNAERLKKDLMPPMDMAYSALLEDLEKRGLLEDTLVVWMGEFGRTPKINKRGGRDHWGHVYSTALAGGGIHAGQVYGSSDKQAGYPVSGRVEPQDLTATIFHCLGYTPETKIHDALGREFTITKGSPIGPVLI